MTLKMERRGEEMERRSSKNENDTESEEEMNRRSPENENDTGVEEKKSKWKQES